MDVEYNEETRVHKINGRVAPSVTQVLNEGGLIDTRFFDEWHADRGTQVHKAIHLLEEDRLNLETLDLRLEGYLRSWKKFRREIPFEIEEQELPVADASLGCVGKLDLFGRLYSQTVVVDIKTGSPNPWHGVQLAGYLSLTSPGAYLLSRRYGLYLRNDEDYRLLEYKEPSDRDIFMSCLWIAKWKRKHGLIEEKIS